MVWLIRDFLVTQAKRYIPVIISSFLAISCIVLTVPHSFARGNASNAVPSSQSANSGNTKIASRNLIINGDFEYFPECKIHGQMQVDKGSKTIYGWSVTSGSVRVLQGLEWLVQYGKKCVELNGSGPGLIAQKIVTEPGARYKVKFWLAANPQGGIRKSMFVRAAEQSAAWSIECSGVQYPEWAPMTFKFTAEEPSTTIEFGSTISGSCGNLIDNVSVEKISSEK
jgi:choice-of-anchor C domain-containing protein